jgi:hypothetical protein
MLHEDASHNDFSIVWKANLFMWIQTSICRNALCCNRVLHTAKAAESLIVCIRRSKTLHVQKTVLPIYLQHSTALHLTPDHQTNTSQWFVRSRNEELAI